MPGHGPKRTVEPLLGGHALPLGHIFPRWLGMLLIGIVSMLILATLGGIGWIVFQLR